MDSWRMRSSSGGPARTGIPKFLTVNDLSVDRLPRVGWTPSEAIDYIVKGMAHCLPPRLLVWRSPFVKCIPIQ